MSKLHTSGIIVNNFDSSGIQARSRKILTEVRESSWNVKEGKHFYWQVSYLHLHRHRNSSSLLRHQYFTLSCKAIIAWNTNPNVVLRLVNFHKQYTPWQATSSLTHPAMLQHDQCEHSQMMEWPQAPVYKWQTLEVIKGLVRNTEVGRWHGISSARKCPHNMLGQMLHHR